MDDNKRRELLTEGGELLKLVESLVDAPEEVLSVNEMAAMQLLVGKSEGEDVSEAICKKAREMLLLIEFIRSMKSVDSRKLQ